MGERVKKIISLVTAFVMVALGTSAFASAFTPGDVVIYRVGGLANGADGAALTNVGNIVYLDEYTTNSSGATLVQSIQMPTAYYGANSPLVADGLSSAEGEITRSTDGRFIVLTGYGAAPGQSYPYSLPSQYATFAPRVVGLVDGSGRIDTTTAQTNSLSDDEGIRSAASTDGTNIWLSGDTSGFRYTTVGSSMATQLTKTITNIRQINIFSNNLYFTTASGAGFRIGTITNTMPVTVGGAYMSNVISSVTAVGSPYGLLLLKLTGGAAPFDTLYYADDTAAGSDGTGVIFKYSLVSGNWNSNGFVNAPAVRGLTGFADGSGNVHLFATTGGTGSSAGNTGGGSLYSFIDTTGYNQDPNEGDVNDIKDISFAGDAHGTEFRGIALVPVGSGSLPPDANLSVGPALGFFVNGSTGCTPTNTYTYSVANLTNTAANPMNWSVSSDSHTWVTLSTTSSTLGNGGSISVTVSLNGDGCHQLAHRNQHGHDYVHEPDQWSGQPDPPGPVGHVRSERHSDIRL